MLGRGLVDPLGVGASVGATVSVGAALVTGAGEGPTEATGADVGAAAPPHAETARASMTPIPVRTHVRLAITASCRLAAAARESDVARGLTVVDQ